VGLGSRACASGALRLLEDDDCLLEGDRQGFGRVLLQQGGQQAGPGGHGGLPAAPFVHLAGGDAGDNPALAACRS